VSACKNRPGFSPFKAAPRGCPRNTFWTYPPHEYERPKLCDVRLGRFEVDLGGLLLALGFFAMMAWLVQQGHWIGIPSMVFSIWWGWHAMHDKPIALDIKNAPDDDPTEPVEPFLAGCCFCGEPVSSEDADFWRVVVTEGGNEERWQGWFCHAACFTSRLAQPTDNPDVFKPDFE
jgi:hypothetical protein